MNTDSTEPTGPTDPPMDEAESRRVGSGLEGGRHALEKFYWEVARHLALPRTRSWTSAPPDGLSPSAAADSSGELLTDGTPSAPAWRENKRLWLPSLAALVLLVWGASFLAWPTGSSTIPEWFCGTWVSTHAGYEGRRLVITGSTVQVIVSKESNPPPAVVRSANARLTPEGPLLHLVYATADGADTLEMTLLTPSTLRLRHPADVVWERLVDQRPTRSASAAP